VRGGSISIALTLVVAAIGYTWQGSPLLAGAPSQGSVIVGADPAEWVDMRRRFYGPAPGKSAAWLYPGDAMARHGEFGNAAAILLGATERNPDDPEAWVALANGLIGHAGGHLTPAAALAYDRAIAAAPSDPAPRFFLAAAIASSGRQDYARQIWTDVMATAPAEAPWRADAERWIARNLSR
jgi:cytochrome c-type biogenesis protein CcmH